MTNAHLWLIAGIMQTIVIIAAFTKRRKFKLRLAMSYLALPLYAAILASSLVYTYNLAYIIGSSVCIIFTAVNIYFLTLLAKITDKLTLENK